MLSSPLRKVLFAAMLTAIAVVLKVFLGLPITFMGSFVKDLNFSPAVIMLSGMLLGPVLGGIVGALVDLLAFIIRPMGGFVPLFTLTSALFGVLGALIVKPKNYWRCLLGVVGVQLVCSSALNTLWLILLGFIPETLIWFRVLGGIIPAPIYAAIIFFTAKYLPAHIKIGLANNNSIPPKS